MTDDGQGFQSRCIRLEFLRQNVNENLEKGRLSDAALHTSSAMESKNLVDTISSRVRFVNEGNVRVRDSLDSFQVKRSLAQKRKLSRLRTPDSGVVSFAFEKLESICKCVRFVRRTAIEVISGSMNSQKLPKVSDSSWTKVAIYSHTS